MLDISSTARSSASFIAETCEKRAAARPASLQRLHRRSENDDE